MAWRRSVRPPVGWPHQLVAQSSQRPLKCCSGTLYASKCSVLDLADLPKVSGWQPHCCLSAALLLGAKRLRSHIDHRFVTRQADVIRGQHQDLDVSGGKHQRASLRAAVTAVCIPVVDPCRPCHQPAGVGAAAHLHLFLFRQALTINLGELDDISLLHTPLRIGAEI
jgi:hypothetical protein